MNKNKKEFDHPLPHPNTQNENNNEPTTNRQKYHAHTKFNSQQRTNEYTPFEIWYIERNSWWLKKTVLTKNDGVLVYFGE